MRKTIITLLFILALMLPASCAAQMSGNYSDNDTDSSRPMMPTNALNGTSEGSWDISYSFSANDAGQPGIETNGEHIYTSDWRSATTNSFWKYSMDGTFLESFDIPGVSAIRDMAYDGAYFYGSNVSTTNLIYIMDLPNKSLIGTIPVTCTGIVGVRHIAYDPGLDEGNGGFWIGGWSTLGAIDMGGNEIYGNTSPAVTNLYGSAYDPWTTGGPYLWFFSQSGEAVMHQFNIATRSTTGVTHVCNEISSGLAGGAATYDNAGMFTLLANIQDNPNIIVAYELSPTNLPPVADFACNPASPSASQMASFDASTSYDPDGTIASYEWDWETNGTYDSTGVTVSHTFHTCGDHPVTLRVTDNLGVTGTFTLTVCVHAPISPLAAFIPMERMRLTQANTLLSLVLEQLPEDIPDNVRVLLERVDQHMKCVSVTSVNPIHANGELIKALTLLEQIQTLL